MSRDVTSCHAVWRYVMWCGFMYIGFSSMYIGFSSIRFNSNICLFLCVSVFLRACVCLPFVCACVHAYVRAGWLYTVSSVWYRNEGLHHQHECGICCLGAQKNQWCENQWCESTSKRLNPWHADIIRTRLQSLPGFHKYSSVFQIRCWTLVHTYHSLLLTGFCLHLYCPE